MTAVGAADADIAGRAPRQRVSPSRLAGSIVVTALFGFGIYSLTQIDFSIANLQTSVDNAVRTFSQMDPISFPSPGDLAYLIGLTLGVVILGTVVAALISIPVAYIAAANTTPAPWLRWLGRGIGVATRAVPDVVIALAASLLFAIGSTLPGVIAIGIHSIGMISKLFADAIEQIDEGPVMAIRAAGGSRAQQFWSGVVPQVFPSWIATALHRFDINLRGSVILGYAGVGGLGYAMQNYFKHFPQGYGPGLGIAIVIFLLCIVGEIVSSTVRRNLLGIQPSGRGVGDRIVHAATRGRAPRTAAVRGASAELAAGRMPRRPWTSERVRSTIWGWVGAAVIVASVFLAHVDFTQVVWKFFWQSIGSFWPPSFGSHEFTDFLEALLITIEVAFAAATLSFVISLAIGSLAARNVAPNASVRGTFRVLLVVFRGVPELVLAILLIMITGLGNQAGVIALAFGGIGLLGKLIADSFEEVPRGPERALTTTGASRLQVYGAATLPQGMPSLIGNSLYLVDTNLRAATILGIVGGGGVGFYLTQASSIMALHGQVTTLVIMVFVVVLAVEGIATWLRHVFR